MAARGYQAFLRKLLATLPRERLWAITDHFEIDAADRRSTEGLITSLLENADEIDLDAALELLQRTELQEICGEFSIEGGGREKEGYRQRILEYVATHHARTDAGAVEEPPKPRARRAAARRTEAEPERAAPVRTRRRTEADVVFIAHGQDDGMRLTFVRFVEKLGLNPVVLQDEASGGLTLIEKQERFQRRAIFGVILLSPDDMGFSRKDGPDKAKPRARQNVILELGLLLGVLGRDRIAVIQQGDLELPSDIHGLVRIPYDRDHHDAAHWRLAKELKEAGFEVDLNKI